MNLRERLKQARENRAERKAAQIQTQTEEIAYQLYLQRQGANKEGDESGDWDGAQKIVKNPVRRSLYRLARVAPVRWGLSGWENKTPWRWLELLIVPLFLAAGAFYLENRVEERQERIADARAKQEVLDSYLEQMQGLLLDRGLRVSSEDSEVRSVARAITTTAIKELDSERNALLINFLQESDLLRKGDSSTEISDSENTPNRSGIELFKGLNLSGSNLGSADLSSSSLNSANLSGSDLSLADLSLADLSLADLRLASLSGANLGGSDLSRANLSGSDLSGSDLFSADLFKAILFSADLRSADLYLSDLREATLSLADLRGADLRGSDLRGAKLRGAKLRGADLRDAVHLSEDQLQFSTLCKTQLPEGFAVDPNRDC